MPRRSARTAIEASVAPSGKSAYRSMYSAILGQSSGAAIRSRIWPSPRMKITSWRGPRRVAIRYETSAITSAGMTNSRSGRLKYINDMRRDRRRPRRQLRTAVRYRRPRGLPHSSVRISSTRWRYRGVRSVRSRRTEFHEAPAGTRRSFVSSASRVSWETEIRRRRASRSAACRQLLRKTDCCALHTRILAARPVQRREDGIGTRARSLARDRARTRSPGRSTRAPGGSAACTPSTSRPRRFHRTSRARD